MEIFQQGKIEGLITFYTELQVQKTPPERGFVSCLRLVTAKQLYYVNTESIPVPRRTRNFGRILTYLVHR